MPADLFLFNGRFVARDERRPEAAAIAVQGGRILATRPDAGVMRQASADTRLAGVMSCACGAL